MLLLNKPYGVICQFSPSPPHQTLAQFIDIPEVYPAGRLDADSEGLVILTADGRLAQRITSPAQKLPKYYWVQVEGQVTERALALLRRGVHLRDGVTRPAEARVIDRPAGLWERRPPIRHRKQVPDTWIELVLSEGRNRQVRRMTAAAGHPTLRLIRHRIGPWSLAGLQPGATRWERALGHRLRSRELADAEDPRAP